CYTTLLTSVGRTVMLVVFRNPKDTVVSYYHFMNTNPVLPNAKSWDSFFTDFMEGEVAWGSYFDHALAWEKLMDNPNILMVTYEQMKETLGVEKQVQGPPPFSSKHNDGHYGEVGDWKNHLSEAQSKQMDEEFEKQLAHTKLGAKLKYDIYCK
uniref:Sulfotransferase n=1 Tax=Hucho hucho TaxID=62062 RepID=A0A4W5KDZ6_9TELE